MKCLIFATVIAVASAGFYPGPTLYNYGPPYTITGYSYGYNAATPLSRGYSYSTFGATPPHLAALPYAATNTPSFYLHKGGQSHDQYRVEDAAGNEAFGYAGGPSSRNEVRRSDGVVRGSFSYVDAHGIVQSRVYVADANGFRVAATDLPQQAPPRTVAAVSHHPVLAPAIILKTAASKMAEVNTAHFVPHAEALDRSKREASLAVGRINEDSENNGPLLRDENPF